MTDYELAIDILDTLKEFYWQQYNFTGEESLKAKSDAIAYARDSIVWEVTKLKTRKEAKKV